MPALRIAKISESRVVRGERELFVRKRRLRVWVEQQKQTPRKVRIVDQQRTDQRRTDEVVSAHALDCGGRRAANPPVGSEKPGQQPVSGHHRELRLVADHRMLDPDLRDDTHHLAVVAAEHP